MQLARAGAESPFPQPPPWAVGCSAAAMLQDELLSHPRVPVESQTTRRRHVPDHLSSSQGRLSPQSSFLVGRPVGRVAVGKATVLGRASQEKDVSLAQEAYCLKVPPEADHSAHQVLPCPMSLSFQPQSHGTYPGPHKGPHHKALPWLSAPRPLKLVRSEEPSSRSFLKTEFSNGRQI